MSQYCTQCGTENVNDAKFCKSCGHSLIEKEPSSGHEQPTIQTEPLPKQDEVANVSEIVSEAKNSSEVPSSWSGWLLLIPVIAWVLYRLAILGGGSIGLMFGLMTVPNVVAEALGGAAAIIGIPLIATGIIYFVKKTQDAQYGNFVKHTLVTSILMLALGIAANINTIRDEQTAAAMQTISEVEPAARAMTAEEKLAADAVTQAAEVAPAPPKIITQEERAFNAKVEKAHNEGGIGTLQFPVTFSEFKEAELNCNNGQGKSCTALGQMYYPTN
jgi:hypothetical protein